MTHAGSTRANRGGRRVNKAVYALCALLYAALHVWVLHGHGESVEARQAPPIAPQMDIKRTYEPQQVKNRAVNEPINGEWGAWG